SAAMTTYPASHLDTLVPRRSGDNPGGRCGDDAGGPVGRLGDRVMRSLRVSGRPPVGARFRRAVARGVGGRGGRGGRGPGSVAVVAGAVGGRFRCGGCAPGSVAVVAGAVGGRFRWGGCAPG